MARRLKQLQAVSKADKVIWKDAGITTSMLVRYYEKIAPYAANFFRERPLEYIHAPCGLQGDDVRRLHVTRGVLRTPDDFTACGRAAVVEIHSRGIRLDAPHRRDWITLQFVSHASPRLYRVVKAAQDFLSEMKITGVWKLAGATDVDLMIPIARQYEPASVFDFSKILAELLHEQSLTESTIKPELGSRILIDYHCNHHHRVIVAPFSPRAMRVPRIDLPLPWFELEKSLRIEHTVPAISLDVSRSHLANAQALIEAAERQKNDLDDLFSLIEGMLAKSL